MARTVAWLQLITREAGECDVGTFSGKKGTNVVRMHVSSGAVHVSVVVLHSVVYLQLPGLLRRGSEGLLSARDGGIPGGRVVLAVVSRCSAGKLDLGPAFSHALPSLPLPSLTLRPVPRPDPCSALLMSLLSFPLPRVKLSHSRESPPPLKGFLRLGTQITSWTLEIFSAYS